MEEFLGQYGVYLGLALLIIEYILGKTTLVESGSTLELIFNGILSLGKKLLGEKK